MRAALVLLLLLPTAQACIATYGEQELLSVSDSIAMVALDASVLQINLATGKERSFPIPFATEAVPHGENRFLVGFWECLHEPYQELYDGNGNLIGEFALEGRVRAWNHGFAGITNWDWNGNPLPGGPPPWTYDGRSFVSSDGHSGTWDWHNDTVALSTGTVLSLPETPREIALSPGGKTIGTVRLEGRDAEEKQVQVRGDANWNWTVDAVGRRADLAMTETHVGVNEWVYRLNMKTGTIEHLNIAEPMRSVAADDELYWGTDGRIISETKQWIRENGTWNEVEHPGWRILGTGTPWHPPEAKDGTNHEAQHEIPGIAVPCIALMLAMFARKRTAPFALLLILLIPIAMGCTNDTQMAARGQEVAVTGLVDAVIDFASHNVTQMPGIGDTLLAGPEQFVFASTSRTDAKNWTHRVTYTWYDGDVREIGAANISWECAPFVAWEGGFGGAAYWDWNGTPIEVPWSDAVRAVSPDGATWIEQHHDGAYIFGDMSGFIPGQFRDFSIENGIAAVSNWTTVHLVGHHAWTWTAPSPIHDIDIHEGHVYIAHSHATRISLQGDAEQKDVAMSATATDGGYFAGSSFHFFRGGIDYYGYGVVGPHWYEHNEREWKYVKQTPWTPLGVQLEPPIAWQPAQPPESRATPPFGLAIAIPFLAFFKRQRNANPCAR